MSAADSLAAIRRVVGPCRDERESEDGERCGQPAEYVLWGKLIPKEGLGPRCYHHAAVYVSEYGLRRGSGYALIHLGELASAATLVHHGR